MAVLRRVRMVSMVEVRRRGQPRNFVLGEEEAVALLRSVGSSVSWCPIPHEEYWASGLMGLLQPEGKRAG